MVFGKLFLMLCFATVVISFASLLVYWLFLICYLHKLIIWAADHGLIKSLLSFASSPFAMY
jgi:hypothetical protein